MPRDSWNFGRAAIPLGEWLGQEFEAVIEYMLKPGSPPIMPGKHDDIGDPGYGPEVEVETVGLYRMTGPKPEDRERVDCPPWLRGLIVAEAKENHIDELEKNAEPERCF